MSASFVHEIEGGEQGRGPVPVIVVRLPGLPEEWTPFFVEFEAPAPRVTLSLVTERQGDAAAFAVDNIEVIGPVDRDICGNGLDDDCDGVVDEYCP